jgi:hypothetical protein
MPIPCTFLSDAKCLVQGLKRVMASGGSAAVTTIIKNDRYADHYLRKLAEGGALTERDPAQLMALFTEQGMNGSYCAKGNMAFINIGKTLPFFAANECQSFGV